MATLTTATPAALPSSAERSVREVALRLGIPNIDHVVLQMRQEYVLTDWQLSALDSFQWKSLGAPIGLAVAVHQIAQQEQRQQQQKLFVFPPVNETAQESKILHDLDQHNHMMESTISGIHNSSMDQEEKEDDEAPASHSTVVDAAVQDEPININEESEPVHEKSPNSEQRPEVDAASNENDYLTESAADTKSESSENDSDDDNAAPESTPVEETGPLDNVEEPKEDPVVIIEETASIKNSHPQEPQDEHVDVDATSAVSIIENDSDENADGGVQVVTEGSLESAVDERPPLDDNSKPATLLTSTSGVSTGELDSINNAPPRDSADGPSLDTQQDAATLEDTATSLDKSPSLEESSSSSDSATVSDEEDMNTVPTTSLSEETSLDLSKPAVSPTLSAPLPHDECDDSFHVSASKELLLKPSFDSEDISEDLESFGGTSTTTKNNEQDPPKDDALERGAFPTSSNNEQIAEEGNDSEKKEALGRNVIQERSTQSFDSFDVEQEQDMDEEEEFQQDAQDGSKQVEESESDSQDPMERNFFQEQSSQSFDSFNVVDEEDLLDPEDDIIISGEDLMVDLSAGETQAASMGLTTNSDTRQIADDSLQGSFPRAALPMEMPTNTDKTEVADDPFTSSFGPLFHTEFPTKSDLDDEEDAHKSSSNMEDSFSQEEPYVMHKRTVSSLESLYFVDGDECTVVASNVSPERRNRPKRRRSLEDDSTNSHHPIHAFNHVSSFDVEWDEFCLVLKTLESKTQRTIWSQLLIMSNGRTKQARMKMAKQVSVMILKNAQRPQDPIQRKAQSSQLKSNLQLFAKLHREERKALGKKIFEQISKLYAGGEDEKKETANDTPPDAAPADQQQPLEEDDEEASEQI